MKGVTDIQEIVGKAEQLGVKGKEFSRSQNQHNLTRKSTQQIQPNSNQIEPTCGIKYFK